MIKKLLFAWSIIITYQFGYGQRKEVSAGTAIIVCGSKDSLWIAADTKMVIVDGAVTKSAPNVCKIYISNGVISAFAGVNGTIDGRFSIVNTFQRAIQKERDLTKALNSFDSAVVSFLNNNVSTAMKLQHTTNGSTIKASSKVLPIIGCVFAHYVDGKRKITLENFFYLKDSTDRLLPVSSRFVDSNNAPFYMLGHTSGIRSFLMGNHSFFKEPGSISSKLARLIEIQANETPDTVGKPVDVLVSSLNGNQWAVKSGECAEF